MMKNLPVGLSRWLPIASVLLTVACDRSTSESTAPADVPAIQVPAADAITDEELVDKFHQHWYDDNTKTWALNKWFGIQTLQNPMDVWITQEIIFETKPDVIVECGAFHGGSAALWATILEQLNPEGRVISIDIEDNLDEARKLSIVQRKVDFIIGSSTAPEVIADVKKRSEGKKVMVILDSDHRKPHVLRELQLYSPMIPVGGYIIVQDTNVNGHPAKPDFGPGPWEAVEEFMQNNKNFIIDKSRERLKLTFNPSGFLKRVR